MRNTNLFWFKINFTFVIFFLLFLSVFSVRLSYADTCLRGPIVYIEREVLAYGPQVCPNSGDVCEYGIKESQYRRAWCCHGININTAISPCRIRESEVATNPFWNWPIIGDTLGGPCFPVIGSAPCGPPNEITIWYQWVEPLGSEAACDPSDCFFCQDNIDDIPVCGLENSRCPE
jgi:hypothetical protein